MTADLQKRLGYAVGVGIFVSVGYRLVQEITLTRSHFVADCWSWHIVPFSAGWVLPYLSVFFLMGLPWLLLPSLGAVRQFALRLLIIELVAWSIFLVAPTACVRPDFQDTSFLYTLLQRLDRPNNCMPCLHSALTVLAGWSLWKESHLFSGNVPRALLAIWASFIVAAIFGLRQHTGFDVVAGTALGVATLLLRLPRGVRRVLPS